MHTTAVRGTLDNVRGALRGARSTAVFVLKVLPIFPSRPIDWITPSPVIERVRYPTTRGFVEAEVWRPSTEGPHPGVMVCLGVIPFGYDHPQIPRLLEALARAGFAAVLYWSPAMRDYRLEPDDIKDLAFAYEWLISQPFVDPERSGFIGTCVGGSFVLMAAADARIRDRVGFVAAFAPYSSMWTLARDIATSSWVRGAVREHWSVDPLSRKVFVHTLTDILDPEEATQLREVFDEPDGCLNPHELSDLGQSVYPLLAKPTLDEAEVALHRLKPEFQTRLDLMSPLNYIQEMGAPFIALMHDRADSVIPVTESESLWEALSDRPNVYYTQFTMFKHLDPTKVHLHLLPLLRELGHFSLSLYRVFRQTA